MEYTTIREINEYVSKSVSPSNTPNTMFEVYSVPSFDTDHPEYLLGSEIASNKQLVQKGDVLLCKINPRINRVWIVADETEYQSIASSEWIVIRSREYYPEFLAWYFQSPIFKKLMVSEVTGIGGSLTRAQPKRVAEYPVPKVDKDAQKQIVLTLNCINKVISTNKQQLAELDELVKARFVEMFNPCKNNIMIGDVITICRGASPRPIVEYITDNPNGVNWIKIGDAFEDSPYITHTAERITPEGASRSRPVHKGDFILSNSMSFGRPYILGIDGCVHDGWLILSDFHDTFHELYLYHALRSEFVQHQFKSKVNGVTVKNLNSDLVKATYIKLPDRETQNQFASFVTQIEKSKAAVQRALDKAQQLFDSLMQKYFG